MSTTTNPAHYAPATRILIVTHNAEGQYKYRAEWSHGLPLLDWQWGTFDEAETVAQAIGRFGSFDAVLAPSRRNYVG